jgi:hypothetical protein
VTTLSRIDTNYFLEAEPELAIRIHHDIPSLASETDGEGTEMAAISLSVRAIRVATLINVDVRAKACDSVGNNSIDQKFFGLCCSTANVSRCKAS